MLKPNYSYIKTVAQTLPKLSLFWKLLDPSVNLELEKKTFPTQGLG